MKFKTNNSVGRVHMPLTVSHVHDEEFPGYDFDFLTYQKSVFSLTLPNTAGFPRRDGFLRRKGPYRPNAIRQCGAIF